jgi:hypothetical protein
VPVIVPVIELVEIPVIELVVPVIEPVVPVIELVVPVIEPVVPVIELVEIPGIPTGIKCPGSERLWRCAG